jgi:NDP-sugar pyrophosphorylase family protein
MQDRNTSRYLLFDDQLQLCGRSSTRDPQKLSRACSGLHSLSPRLLPMMDEEGAFSIITTYLNLAARGDKILAFRADEYDWRDLGRPEDLERERNTRSTEGT